jgi:hypothetical protein
MTHDQDQLAVKVQQNCEMAITNGMVLGFMQDEHTLSIFELHEDKIVQLIDNTSAACSWYEVPIFLQPSELSLQCCMSDS